MCSPGVDKRAKLNYNNCYAGVAELADAPALGAGVLDVQVQVLSPAPRRRKLHIACGDFLCYAKNHLALTTLLLLSAKSHARLTCSVASAFTTVCFRYQLFAAIKLYLLCID